MGSPVANRYSVNEYMQQRLFVVFIVASVQSVEVGIAPPLTWLLTVGLHRLSWHCDKESPGNKLMRQCCYVATSAGLIVMF